MRKVESKSFWNKSLMINVVTLIISVCICMLVACTSPTDGSDGYYSDADAPARSIPVTITSGRFNTSARSILPDDWAETEKSILTYSLTGSATNGLSYDKTYAYGEIKNGIKIYIEPGEWTFTLEGKLDNNVVLTGTKTVSITSPATIPISLEPNTSSTVTGTLNIESLVFTNNIGVDASDIKVYVLKEYKDELTNAIKEADVTLTPVDGNRVALKALISDLNAGEYYVAIQFGTNPTIYKENLIIDPYKTSTLNDELESDFFLTEPKAPTNLRVAYPENLNKDVAVTEYLATFTWNCDATNELGYTLVLKDDNDKTYTYSENPSLATPTENIESGSLADNSGSGSVVIKLKTGLNYSAYIVAWNTVGDSDKCYLDDSEDARANITAVTYHLNKGNLILTGTAQAIVGNNLSTGNYVDYFTRKTTASYTFPTGGTTAPRVYKADKDEDPTTDSTAEMQFEGWFTTADFKPTAEILDPTIDSVDVNLTDHGNIDLYAKWTFLRELSPITFPHYVDPFKSNSTIEINKTELAESSIDMTKYLDSEYDTFVWYLNNTEIGEDKVLVLKNVAQITGTGTYNIYFETKKSTVERSRRSTTITLVVNN